MNNEPNELKLDDVQKFIDKMIYQEIVIHICNWCEVSHYVREVGPNYICPECEIKERAAGRPLVFTSPVRDAFFKIEEMGKD